MSKVLVPAVKEFTKRFSTVPLEGTVVAVKDTATLYPGKQIRIMSANQYGVEGRLISRDCRPYYGNVFLFYDEVASVVWGGK